MILRLEFRFLIDRKMFKPPSTWNIKDTSLMQLSYSKPLRSETQGRFLSEAAVIP